VLNALRNERLVVVSNRLPLVIGSKDNRITISKASGGLITALQPLLRAQNGVWIGWPGPTDFPEDVVFSETERFEKEIGCRLVPVMLTKEEIRGYYDGFSNEIIWPLFHDLHSLCNFDPSYWKQYEAVNEKFAKKIMETAEENDFLWIQDYHLILVAKKLKEMGFKRRITFFLHIPFAPLDIFMKIPWRFELLRAMLSFDAIGFQTMRDQRNFIHSVRTLINDAAIRGSGNKTMCLTQNSETEIGTFPISIDYKAFDKASEKVGLQSEKIKETLQGKKIVFSLDRLDYTKGIPYRLEAIRTFFQKHPEYIGKVQFIQVVVPSRTDIPGYFDLKQHIDQLVGEINSEFSKTGWTPVQYMFHPLSEEQLLSFYRAADVCLVTPVKDGMNLVSKEYVAANVDETGVLVLSEFAGAACQLKKQAILINPYDKEGTAEAIYKALEMPAEERRDRMRRLRQKVHKEDIYHWIDHIFTTINDEEGGNLEYVPPEKPRLY